MLGVSPEDALHIGDDRRNDIWGARDAGCDAWLWGSDVHSFKEVCLNPNHLLYLPCDVVYFHLSISNRFFHGSVVFRYRSWHAGIFLCWCRLQRGLEWKCEKRGLWLLAKSLNLLDFPWKLSGCTGFLPLRAAECIYCVVCL